MRDALSLIESTRASLEHHPTLRPGGRVLVAMSGGVDSSVVAALLHHLSFEAVGVSMHLFPKSADSGAAGRCCTLDDFQDARRVAWEVGIPHYVSNYEHEFDKAVISPFVEAYLQGETPSPCILCNQHLKFGSLLHMCASMDASVVATGHYARIEHDEAGFHLRAGLDAGKDQSYFLFPMPPDVLARTLFPLGGMSKPEVRLLADHFGLHLGQKAESQEICFVGDQHYTDILTARTGQAPLLGDLRHVDGRLLGHHDGYWQYTIGQRRGLGIAHAEPLYVVSVDPETNTVLVGEDRHLYSDRFAVRDLVRCRPCDLAGVEGLKVKIRSRSAAVPCRVQATAEGLDVVLLEAQRAVAPGQAAVFYQEDEVLAGGWITRGGQK